MKEEQIELASPFQLYSGYEAKANGRFHGTAMNTAGDAPSFSLDEFSGHVDHIQLSLNNIRDFMFNKLPDGCAITDLFDDEHALLSPLLPPTSNLLTEDDPTGKNGSDLFYSSSVPNDVHGLSSQSQSNIPQHSTSNETIMPSPLTNVNNELLEQLIHESAKIEEQQQMINQLERDKMNLQGQIHRLEQQTRK